MSCRRDSGGGADWMRCYHGTLGCPRIHDGMTPLCVRCEAGDCPYDHEPQLAAHEPVADWCARHPEDRERLMGRLEREHAS